MTRSLDELQRGQHRHTLALHFGGGGKSESMAIDVLRVLDVVRLASSCYHRLVHEHEQECIHQDRYRNTYGTQRAVHSG
jgi:hypothetical protein